MMALAPGRNQNGMTKTRNTAMMYNVRNCCPTHELTMRPRTLQGYDVLDRRQG